MLDTDFIKSRRKKLGLTQKQAAELACLSSPHYWSWLESGKAKGVQTGTLIRVANALKCKASRLLKD